jgi:hypothetical protein
MQKKEVKMKYINLISIAGLLLPNSNDALAGTFDMYPSGIYSQGSPDNSGFSIDARPATPRPVHSASAFLSVPLFPTLIGGPSESSCLTGTYSSVSPLDSLPRDGDLEEELDGLMRSAAKAPASQPKFRLCSSKSSADAYPSDDETYMPSMYVFRILDELISPFPEISTPTEHASSEDESVQPAPKTPVATGAVLPTVFQPVATSPAPVAQPSNPLLPGSPNLTPDRTAGQKRRRAPEPAIFPIPLAKKLSGLFGDEQGTVV